MKFNLKILVQVSLLVAVDVVLTRFCSISTPTLRIGFGFAPVALCAILFGPVWAGAAAAMADFLGAVLFPVQGAYFVGFTLSAALTGVVFGLFLYRREMSWPNIIGAVLVNCVGISLGLSTLWLRIITGTPCLALAATRLVQCAIMIAVQVTILKLMEKPAAILLKRLPTG